jgi:Right handed beta helix region
MTANHLAILALVVACSTPRTHATIQHVGVSCDPVTYGAIADDGISDRAAFQAALDAGGLCIGPGRWTMERAKPGSYNRFAALSTHGHGVTIAGLGPTTVLELAGDQGGGATSVISVDPGAGDVAIRDLTIDTTAATHTDEQTHAIATSGNCSAALGTCQPIVGLTITRIAFVHPPAADGGRKGDCIRLLGNTVATAVTGVTITDITGAVCARAFVELQRGLHGVTITGNRTTFCGDQCIDSEPTGDSTATDDDIKINDNRFDCADGSQGDSDVSLGGAGEPMRQVRMRHNTLCRGIRTYRVSDVVIEDNTIGGAMRGTEGVIEIANTCTGLIVAGNAISRSGSPGPMVRAGPGHTAGALCHDVAIRDNTMVQNTAGSGVWFESVSGATIARNTIQWTAPAPGAFGFYDRSTVAPVTGLQVKDNTWIGAIGYAVCLSAAPYPFGDDVTITGNTSSAGIECIGSGGFAPMEIGGLLPRRCP